MFSLDFAIFMEEINGGERVAKTLKMLPYPFVRRALAYSFPGRA
jgi:hypothetical protein